MPFFVRRPWDLPERLLTPEAVYRQREFHRRQFLREMGLAIGGAALLGGCSDSEDEIRKAGAYKAPLPEAEPDAEDQEPEAAPPLPGGAAPRNSKFSYGRTESVEIETQRFTNFYEFTTTKQCWRYVDKFEPRPWTLEVQDNGFCRRPQVFDIDALHKAFSYEERCYRHRCVEAWAMCVPWTGFPLRDLLNKVEPTAAARYVRFESLYKPEQCPAQGSSLDEFPWPYVEGLTIAEAMNELTLIGTGIYGHQLPKQNGAPLRLIVPWKYGFKGAKSLVRISLTDKRPETFWTVVQPGEYAFQANVEPDVPHPRWSQKTEWMLGTRERFPTKLYNGYGDYVAGLYR